MALDQYTVSASMAPLLIMTSLNTLPRVHGASDPAEHITNHIYVRFPDVHDRTIWHGPPNDDVDEAWEQLYRCMSFKKLSFLVRDRCISNQNNLP